MTPEMFISKRRRPVRRNPLITQTLYYSKDMESHATGLKRIQDDCDAMGCKVEYEYDDYGFTTIFYRHCGPEWEKLRENLHIAEEGYSHGSPEGYSHGAPQDMPYDIPQDMPYDMPQDKSDDTERESASKYKTEIVSYCLIPRSVREIAEHLGLKDTKNVRRHLRPLLETGKIKMTMPDKPKSQYQKYVTARNKQG